MRSSNRFYQREKSGQPYRLGWSVAIVLLAVLLLVMGRTASAADVDPDELLKQIDERLRPPSAEIFRRITNIRPKGQRRVIVLYTVYMGEQGQLATVLEPADRYGRTLLRKKNGSLWLYRPDKKEYTKMNDRQSFIGGAFNNADILRVDFHREFEAEILEESDGQYLLELLPLDPSHVYEKVLMRVDINTSIPLSVEYYIAGGIKLKTIRFDKMKGFKNGFTRPELITTESFINPRYRSEMVFGKIRPRDFAPEVATLSFMPKIKNLFK